MRSFYCTYSTSRVSTPGNLKSLLDSGGNRTRDLWFSSIGLPTGPYMYKVKSVRKPKVTGSIPTTGPANFSACPVWTHSE